jgi:hypothetical protein
MKLSPILIAAAVAFAGNAVAQSSSTTQERAADSGSGVVDKTKQGAKRVGEATRKGTKRAADATSRAASRGAGAVRNTGEAIARKLPPGPGQPARPVGDSPDTASMGAQANRAGGSAGGAMNDRGDGDRRARMDDAYANWQRQQGQQGQR